MELKLLAWLFLSSHTLVAVASLGARPPVNIRPITKTFGPADYWSKWIQSPASTPSRGKFSAAGDAMEFQCPFDCSEKWDKNLERALPGSDHETFQALPGIFNPNKLEIYCGVHNGTKQCLQKCPNGGIKELVESTLIIPQYMCIDSDCQQNAACIESIQNATYVECETEQGRCGEYRRKVDNYETNRPGDRSQLNDMMKDTCLFIQCSLNCMKPKLVSTCGQAALQNLKGVFEKTMEMFKTMAEPINTSGNSTLPHECNNILI